MDSAGSYTYPQFIIDEKAGQIKVNLIDKASGRVVRHILASELNEIVQDYCLPYRIRSRRLPEDGYR